MVQACFRQSRERGCPAMHAGMEGRSLPRRLEPGDSVELWSPTSLGRNWPALQRDQAQRAATDDAPGTVSEGPPEKP